MITWSVGARARAMQQACGVGRQNSQARRGKKGRTNCMLVCCRVDDAASSGAHSAASEPSAASSTPVASVNKPPSSAPAAVSTSATSRRPRVRASPVDWRLASGFCSVSSNCAGTAGTRWEPGCMQASPQANRQSRQGRPRGEVRALLLWRRKGQRRREGLAGTLEGRTRLFAVAGPAMTRRGYRVAGKLRRQDKVTTG